VKSLGEFRTKPFSPREKQIAECLLEGLDARAMSKRLGVTHQYIRNLIRGMGHKLHIDNRKFHVSVRIAYLMAVQRRLIAPLSSISFGSAFALRDGMRPKEDTGPVSAD
jgi:DNA-binding CsgD family transcriptional regulator